MSYPNPKETGQTPEAAVVLQAGRDLERAILLSGQNVGYVSGHDVPFVIDANGKIQTIEHLLNEPLRINATPRFPDIESFADYVNRFKRAGQTSIFAEREKGLLQAALDYHAPGSPSRGTHTALLILQLSEEWKAWKQFDGKALTQEALADFLELRELDIVEPESARIVEAARDLKLSKDCSFEGKINVVNGTLVANYSETVTERGQLQMPVTWIVRLRPYDHCDPVDLTVKVQYRLVNRSIQFTYRIIRADLVAEQAFKNVVERVKALTEVPLYYGTP